MDALQLEKGVACIGLIQSIEKTERGNGITIGQRGPGMSGLNEDVIVGVAFTEPGFDLGFVGDDVEIGG